MLRIVNYLHDCGIDRDAAALEVGLTSKLTVLFSAALTNRLLRACSVATITGGFSALRLA
jgi:hypothetical protein